MTKKHRNKAALTNLEFVAQAEKYLSTETKVWRKMFGDITGYSPSTVTRMISGDIPVTEIVASLFFAFEIMKHEDRIDYLTEFGLVD